MTRTRSTSDGVDFGVAVVDWFDAAGGLAVAASGESQDAKANEMQNENQTKWNRIVVVSMNVSLTTRRFYQGRAREP
jgi:hypothetical protein